MNPPFVRVELDVDKIVQLYQAGQSLKEVAKAVGSNHSTVGRRLVAAGVTLRSKGEGTRLRIVADGGAQCREASAIGAAAKRTAAQAPLARHLEAIAADYADGASLLGLASKYSATAAAIRVALELHSGGVRSQSEAGLVRLRRPEERQRLANARASSIKVITGRRRSERELALSAAGKERFKVRVGEGEELLQCLLAERGLETVSQQAVDRYNVDLGAFPVAIEVHNNPHHPFSRAALMRRLKHLESRGWVVAYVWISGRYRPITTDVADELVAWVEMLRLDPTARREHRVFRGEAQPGSRDTCQTRYPSSMPAPSSVRDVDAGYERVG